MLHTLKCHVIVKHEYHYKGGPPLKLYALLQTALSFPGEAEDSEEREARDFISKLLVDMSTRLTYTEIQRHPFFSLTNWNSLLEGENVKS